MDQETKDKVINHLVSHNRLIVTAPPGAGKSTLLPLSVMEAIKAGTLPEGKILLLEPRRIAARQIAERMASLLDEPVGKTVGYRIRFENKTSAATRIEVLTEGILTRMLIDDPTLDGASMVIFDEFHERNINSDVALALTREAQQVIRPDLRIMLMSATIDTEALSKALDAPVVESTDRTYPIEIIRTDEELLPLIRRAHREHEGDMIVFLPGEAEIRRCQEALGDSLAPTRVLPLYGMLPQDQQRIAIEPSKEGERKIVLATPIAETSLTIQGVRIVIDSGLYRRMVFNPQNGLSHLETVQISLDMATQRAGRAGRLCAGICYRMWSLATEHRMDVCRTPEILEADLSPVTLSAAAWGESDLRKLPWISTPPASHIAHAVRTLTLLDALDDNGKITAHGHQLAALPCHPRIAQMLIMANNEKTLDLACELAAILEEKDPLNAPANDADIRSRLGLPNKRIRLISEHYKQIVSSMLRSRRNADSNEKDKRTAVLDASTLLAYAYPEMVAKATDTGCGHFRLASGETAFVDSSDELAGHEWLVIPSMSVRNGEGRVFLAAPVDPKELSALVKTKENVTWDSKKGMLIAQKEYRIGVLTLRTEPLKSQDFAILIAQAAQKDGLSMLDFNDEVKNLQQRIAVVNEWHPELLLPDISTEALLETALEWLPMYIGKATTASELKKIDLCTAIWGILSYEQQLEVTRLAPTHVTVPTGSRIRIEYRQGAECPILRVRLQECLGMTDTPTINDGKCPLLMELLSPGFKPVQLTKDLNSFWQGTYFEVRKELRRRYPKHSWPDNPLEAQAVRGVKRKE